MHTGSATCISVWATMIFILVRFCLGGARAALPPPPPLGVLFSSLESIDD